MKIAVLALASATALAHAQDTISQWDLLGQPGDVASVPGTGSSNVTANPIIRGSGLGGASASNCINTNSWDDLGPNDYLGFGFTVDEGYQAQLSEFYIGTRSSATGPGFLGLFSSVDGFTNSLYTFEQPSASFLNVAIDLSGMAPVTGNVEFRVRALNSNSAGGGSIGPSGTFRFSGYFVGGVFDRNMQFTGTVTQVGGCAADFNGDNQADFFDYLDFAAAFDAEDPSADFNGDNQVDFFDYLDFVQAFDAGC